MTAIISPLDLHYELPQDIEIALQQSTYISPDSLSDKKYAIYPSALLEVVLLKSCLIVPCSAIVSRISPATRVQRLCLSACLLFCTRDVFSCSGSRLCARAIRKRHGVASEAEFSNPFQDIVLSAFTADTMLYRHMTNISLPSAPLLDRCGSHRNTYHSLRGMYITLASPDVVNRTHRSNMSIPITRLTRQPFRRRTALKQALETR